MTTPTEELARNTGLILEGKVSKPYLAAIQAFREAVEAEYDAERMKQPAVALMGSIGESRSVVLIDEHPVVYAWVAAGAELTKLYAQPFPYTEQLQQRITMLEAETKMHRANVAHWMKECDALKARLADPAPLLKATEELRTGKEALQQQVKELADVLRDAREFVYRHSEPWYTSGQDLLKEIDAALANTQGDKE